VSQIACTKVSEQKTVSAQLRVPTFLEFWTQVGTRLARASQPPGVRNPSRPHFQQYRENFENNEFIILISADPACSRESASEEKLPAARTARGKKVLQAARGKKQEERRRRCFRVLAAVRFEAWRRAKEKDG